MWLIDSLWSEWLWLPENVTWNHVYSTSDRQFIPRPGHLWMSIVCAGLIYASRRIIERFALTPLANYCGMRAKIIRFESNKTLEAAFRRSRRPQQSEMNELASELNWSNRSVINWFRRRRNKQKATAMKKFVEGGWFFIYYCLAIAYGIAALKGKSYFSETRLCWVGWPHQHVDAEIYWYYMLELGFYFASLAALFSDVKRKDFPEMLMHHVITIWLMGFSWCFNFVRIGALVLIMHDTVDPFIHLAKCCGYAGYKAWCDRFFFVLFVGWFVTRLILYPLWVMRSASIESYSELGPFGAWWVFNGWLCLLLLLHAVWFWFISRIAIQAYTHGELQRDTRSDSEMSATDEDDEDNQLPAGTSRKIIEVKKML